MLCETMALWQTQIQHSRNRDPLGKETDQGNSQGIANSPFQMQCARFTHQSARIAGCWAIPGIFWVIGSHSKQEQDPFSAGVTSVRVRVREQSRQESWADLRAVQKLNLDGCGLTEGRGEAAGRALEGARLRQPAGTLREPQARTRRPAGTEPPARLPREKAELVFHLTPDTGSDLL